MIIASCRCTASQNPGPHHPYCPTVAEPQPLNQTQLTAESDYIIDHLSHNIARGIVFRKNADGSPLFPYLAAHFDPA